MKFNKRNILFKMMFVVLMVFMCFSVCDVEAATPKNYNNKCTYTYPYGNVTSKVHVYPKQDSSQITSIDDLKIAGEGGLTWDKDAEEKVFEKDELFVVSNNTLYCPNKAYICRYATHSGSWRTTMTPSEEKCNQYDSRYERSLYLITLESASGIARGYQGMRDSWVNSDGKTFPAETTVTKCTSTQFETMNNTLNKIETDIPNAEQYALKTDYEMVNGMLKSINDGNTRFCDSNESKLIDRINNITLPALNKRKKELNLSQAGKDQLENLQEQVDKNVEDANLVTSQISNKANFNLPTGNLNKCEELISDDLKDVIDIVLNVVRVAAPILLIILTAVDFGQIVISNDKDAMPKAISKAVKRAIAALVIFFIPFLVDLIIKWLNDYSGIGGAANCIK